jgi:hypothetical protein
MVKSCILCPSPNGRPFSGLPQGKSDHFHFVSHKEISMKRIVYLALVALSLFLAGCATPVPVRVQGVHVGHNNAVAYNVAGVIPAAQPLRTSEYAVVGQSSYDQRRHSGRLRSGRRDRRRSQAAGRRARSAQGSQTRNAKRSWQPGRSGASRV